MNRAQRIALAIAITIVAAPYLVLLASALGGARAPALLTCNTGAGPVVVEGYDLKTGPHPQLSHVWVLTWRREPDDTLVQSVALQPPFECGDRLALRSRHE